MRSINGFWDVTVRIDPSVLFQDLRLWKMDLKGACTLLSYRPEDAGLFGMEVTGDLVYLQIVGIFGWACTPAAFQTVTRAIIYELHHKLQSAMHMYVDDIVGVCFAKDLAADLIQARATCTDLLGSKAVADEKTKSGTRLEIIGYTIDLELRRVSISKRNFLNTLYGFLMVDLDAPIALKEAQRLAAYGSRYGAICRAMRSFSAALYRMAAGRTARMSSFPITEEAKIAIRLWRAMLVLTSFETTRFCRPLHSFDL